MDETWYIKLRSRDTWPTHWRLRVTTWSGLGSPSSTVFVNAITIVWPSDSRHSQSPVMCLTVHGISHPSHKMVLAKPRRHSEGVEQGEKKTGCNGCLFSRRKDQLTQAFKGVRSTHSTTLRGFVPLREKRGVTGYPALGRFSTAATDVDVHRTPSWQRLGTDAMLLFFLQTLRDFAGEDIVRIDP